MKLKYILLACIIILTIGILPIDKATIVVEGGMEGYWAPNVSEVDGEYYFATNKKAYKYRQDGEHKLIYEGDNILGISANKEYVFIVDGPQILRLDIKSGQYKIIYTYPYDGEECSIYANEEYVWFERMSSKTCFDTNGNEIIEKSKVGELQSKVADIQYFSMGNEILMTYKEKQKGKSTICEIFSRTGKDILNTQIVASGVLHIQDEYIIKMHSGCIYKVSKEKEECIIKLPSTEESAYTTKDTSVVIDNNNIVIVYQGWKRNDSNIFYKIYDIAQNIDEIWGPMLYEPDFILESHLEDYIAIYDKETGKLQNEFTTKNKEKIVYTSLEKMITYYRGELIFYNISDWSVEKSIPLKEIKEKKGTTYYFQHMKDKLFIFEGEHELIEVIDIK